MHKDKTQSSTFSACSNEGSYIPLSKIDTDHIRDMLKVSMVDLETVNEWRGKAPKQSGQWNAIFKLAYDVLHGLCEAFLAFDKLKAKTHECVFAYMCEKHQELEWDWNFFEKLRTLRNRSIYYGEPVSYQHWEGMQLQMLLYIKTLKKEVEKRLALWKDHSI